MSAFDELREQYYLWMDEVRKRFGSDASAYFVNVISALDRSGLEKQHTWLVDEDFLGFTVQECREALEDAAGRFALIGDMAEESSLAYDQECAQQYRRYSTILYTLADALEADDAQTQR